MTKKAFTTIELIVAVSLLAVVMAICGSIFNISTKAQRQANAVTEITRNFRAITDQINRDFAGLIADAPCALVFNPNNVVADPDGNRDDRVMFFATGDFQSARQYSDSGTDKTIKGNLAKLYYGRVGNILVRKQKIFIQDGNNDFTDTLAKDNDEYEESFLAEWLDDIAISGLDDSVEIDSSFDVNIPSDVVLVLSEDVTSFGVQYYDGIDLTRKTIEWFPVNADFPLMVNKDKLLANLTLTTPAGWTDSLSIPWALKFTMTLADSRGVIPQGKVFTYIVYLKD